MIPGLLLLLTSVSQLLGECSGPRREQAGERRNRQWKDRRRVGKRTVGGDPKSFPAHSQGPTAAGQYFIDSAIASYLHISNFQGSLCCTVRRSHGNLLVTQSSSSSQNGPPSSSSAGEAPAVVHHRGVSTLDRRLQFGQQPPLLTHLVLGLPLEDAAGGFWHTVIPQYLWGLVQDPSGYQNLQSSSSLYKRALCSPSSLSWVPHPWIQPIGFVSA